MSPDAHDRPDPDMKVVIKARMGMIDDVTRAIGADTDPVRADLTGTSDRQWRRARAGDPVGYKFIAGLLHLLHGRSLPRRLRTDFEGLFEVQEQPTDRDAA